MSSLLVIQEQRQMIFAVDSAHSKVVCNMKTKEKKISRYLNDDVDKIHMVGKDIAFVSGANYVIDPVIEKLNDFLDSKKRIYTEELRKYLFEKYPYSTCPIKDYGLSDIGITILRVMNNEAIIIKMDQCTDFVPVVTKAIQGEIKLSVDGFDNQRIYENASKFLNRLSNFGWRSPEALTTIYQNNYSNGVGGTIKVYKLDWSGCNLIKETKLIEKDIDYITIDEDGNEIESNDKLEFKSCLNACSGTFTGTVQAGQVIGGTVEGATINGSTINGTVINGCTINGGEFISDNPNNQQATSIEGGVITTNALICEGGLGNNFMAQGNYLQMWHPSLQEVYHLDGLGNMMCKTLKVGGWDVITSGNIPPIPNSTNDLTADLTPYGNIDFMGSENAAGVNWVKDNFQPLGASDFRLKNNIRNLDELPDELYFSLKVKLFEYKCSPYKQNLSYIGLLAQEIISAFKNYSLDAFQYGIVEYFDARKYTDECMYTSDGKLLRVNYDQLISWGISINQKLYKQNTELTNRLSKLEKLVNQLVGSEG